jgi:hypothetical protein
MVTRHLNRLRRHNPHVFTKVNLCLRHAHRLQHFVRKKDPIEREGKKEEESCISRLELFPHSQANRQANKHKDALHV